MGKDGEGEEVDNMLQGTYSTDNKNMTPFMASTEMNNFIAALKFPTSVVTGGGNT